MNRVYLVRHGENPANLNKQFSHRLIDYSLTQKGILQSHQTAQFFKNKQIDAIYSSPLKRAHETAQIIAEELDLEVHEFEEFREIDTGILEAQPPSKGNWDLYFSITADWFAGNTDSSFPEGENYTRVIARMRRGLELALNGRDNQNIIVVAHGGIFISTIKDLATNVDVERLIRTENNNCSISELLLNGSDDHMTGEVVCWADCAHITGEAAQFVVPVPDEHSAVSRK